MKLHTWLITAILLLLVATSANSDNWQLDLRVHKLPGLLDATQRLTKDLGGVDLFLAARQFKRGGQSSNHLNFSVSGDWFGVEYLTGENITSDLRAFSLYAPGSEEAASFKTPCSSVLHTYVQQEFDSGFIQFDHYQKDNMTEMKLHARAEF